MTDAKVQARIDRILDPVLDWAMPKLPRWLALLLLVPFAVIIGFAVSIPELFRPFDIQVPTAHGKVTVRWTRYRCWPSGVDAWETEIAKVKSDHG